MNVLYDIFLKLLLEYLKLVAKKFIVEFNELSIYITHQKENSRRLENPVYTNKHMYLHPEWLAQFPAYLRAQQVSGCICGPVFRQPEDS